MAKSPGPARNAWTAASAEAAHVVMWRPAAATGAEGAVSNNSSAHLAFELGKRDISLARDLTVPSDSGTRQTTEEQADVAAAAATAAAVMAQWSTALDLAARDEKRRRTVTLADSALRLADVCAGVESGAALAFAAARLLDELVAMERKQPGSTALASEASPEFSAACKGAVEYLSMAAQPAPRRDHERFATLGRDPLVRAARLAAVGRVLPAACRLWAGSQAPALAAEAASLASLHAIESCAPTVPLLAGRTLSGIVAATSALPADAARRRLVEAMCDAVFRSQVQRWIVELRRVAARRPATGACTLASSFRLWLWSVEHLERRSAKGLLAGPLAHAARLALADVLVWLLAGRSQVMDLVELHARAGQAPDLASIVPVLADMAHAQMARVAGETGSVTAAIVFGSNEHAAWDVDGCAGCYQAEDVEGIDGIVAGMESTARAYADVLEEDGSHETKAGPCASFSGAETFLDMRSRLDACLTGAWLARDRAARALGLG